MAYLAIPLFITLVAGYGYLRFTGARARERAGLQHGFELSCRFIGGLSVFLLLFINTVFLFSHSHGAP
jgi:hypothetical protein